ncbi:MAG: hypothetical protein LBQ65_06850 [Tannerellaceae bacterium]|nr:hypothetical protein [Tannerellaceae bacterium]
MNKRLISGSFWLIMAIHVLVFTGIGFFSAKGWKPLILFLSLLALTLGVGGLIRLYLKKRS